MTRYDILLVHGGNFLHVTSVLSKLVGISCMEAKNIYRETKMHRKYAIFSNLTYHEMLKICIELRKNNVKYETNEKEC